MAEHHIWGNAEPFHGGDDSDLSSSLLGNDLLDHLDRVEFHEESVTSKSGSVKSAVEETLHASEFEGKQALGSLLARDPEHELGSSTALEASRKQTCQATSTGETLALDATFRGELVPRFGGGYGLQPTSRQKLKEELDQQPVDASRAKEVESMTTSWIRANVSDLHGIGECRPCLYLNSKSGCLNGSDCRFCHLPHSKKSRPRPCKAKRNQCKQIVSMLHTVFGHDSQEFHQASERLATESSYMRSILGKVQHNMQSASNGDVGLPPGDSAMEVLAIHAAGDGLGGVKSTRTAFREQCVSPHTIIPFPEH